MACFKLFVMAAVVMADPAAMGKAAEDQCLLQKDSQLSRASKDSKVESTDEVKTHVEGENMRILISCSASEAVSCSDEAMACKNDPECVDGIKTRVNEALQNPSEESITALRDMDHDMFGVPKEEASALKECILAARAPLLTCLVKEKATAVAWRVIR
eukprot:gnl/MRDRNA2_/MRDRNA2_87698_c0_seq1.p1 gnl/MRDRNA2_/MRDRNA2_87698_c0~~gnl/MRDRNA2_/MRDRNA2_87698_c0_seq1.p1  ORF type:complete len:158 (+),score=48.13 gnl/MRDRNA2_/MRDRNA2_87698_c0_seq1:83-556(+)